MNKRIINITEALDKIGFIVNNYNIPNHKIRMKIEDIINDAKRCHKCGAKNSFTNKYCSNCGLELLPREE